jgi:hypothetical protein
LFFIHIRFWTIKVNDPYIKYYRIFSYILLTCFPHFNCLETDFYLAILSNPPCKSVVR